MSQPDKTMSRDGRDSFPFSVSDGGNQSQKVPRLALLPHWPVQNLMPLSKLVPPTNGRGLQCLFGQSIQELSLYHDGEVEARTHSELSVQEGEMSFWA